MRSIPLSLLSIVGGLLFVASPAVLHAGSTTVPCVTHIDSLNYPEVLRAARVHGVVALRLIVASDGSVKSVEKLSGADALATVARENAYKWNFAPSTQVSDVEVEYDFRLVPPPSDLRVPSEVHFDLPSKVIVAAPERESIKD
jgi:TonB family protein